MSEIPSPEEFRLKDCPHDTLFSLRQVEEDFPASQCLSCLTVFEAFPDDYMSFTGGQICFRVEQMKKMFVWDLMHPEGDPDDDPR